MKKHLKYRMTNPEPGMFSAQVRRGWHWYHLDISGNEYPRGTLCSGPLLTMAEAISKHIKNENEKIR